VRDGQRALVLAQSYNRASGFKDPRGLDILAAALAETGDFSEAVRIAQQARTAAVSSGQRDLERQIELRLQGYTSGRPFRREGHR